MPRTKGSKGRSKGRGRRSNKGMEKQPMNQGVGEFQDETFYSDIGSRDPRLGQE